MKKTMTLSRNDDVIVIWKKKEIINTCTILSLYVWLYVIEKLHSSTNPLEYFVNYVLPRRPPHPPHQIKKKSYSKKIWFNYILYMSGMNFFSLLFIYLKFS